MAARKLQTEIDRTLKKVSEGVELFENIYDKMQASTNQTQKEKLELDLKTQIKKLQRLRDQIKTWVASNDIKDKSLLLENRKLIETQMEKFKACEKEMKTKAFSKEGLIQATKLDPKEQEKEDAMQWLQTQVEELQMQIEQTEAEIEALQGTGKKRNKTGSSAAGRLEELENLNERRKWHVSRLEIVLRLLNNGSLSTEKVMALKDDVQYFVESNTEEDFDEDEGIYDELNLDEEEEKFGLVNDDGDSDDSDEASEDIPPRAQSKKHDEESISSNKRDESPILKKAAASLQLRKPSVDSIVKPPPNINFSQQPMASILKASLSQKPPSTPIKYAAAAAAAVAPSSLLQINSSQTVISQQQPITNPPPVMTATQTALPATPHEQIPGPMSSPSLTHPSVTSPILSSSASVSQPPDDSFYSGQNSPTLSETVPSSVSGPAATSSPQHVASKKEVDTIATGTQSSTLPQTTLLAIETSQPQINGNSQPVAVPSRSPSGPSPLPQQVQQYSTNPPTGANSPLSGFSQDPQQPQFPPGVRVSQLDQAGQSSLAPQQSQSAIGGQASQPTLQQQSQPQQRSAAFPGSLSDLVVSFESVKQKAAMRMNNLDQVHKMLEGGYTSIPQPQDTEKPKYYVPRNPYQTAPYYPQTPHPLLNTAGIFSQLDVETLFYVFYYLPGTYQQYLAARELKRQSWRFHVKYLTWFQRHSEPQAITEEYEQGVYVYFDWEGSWCQRKKADFRFEYRYLSEE